MSDPWETLVAAALVGTDRKTPTLSNLQGELGQLVNQLDGEDIGSQLLGAAGAIAVSRQAGRMANEFRENRPPLCPEDDQPLCPTNVHGLLEAVIGGTHSPVLSELLALIQSSGMRVSEQSTPMLLQLGKQRSELRDLIRAVIGQRGRWLAQQNPAWHYMSGTVKGIDEQGNIDQAIAKAQWETETKATRFALLQQLRAQDPEFARDLLASTWKQDKAKERAAFLDCLKIQLGEADEAFLEAALKDRSKEVRAIASNFLAALPTSQFCQRMIERVDRLISIQRHSSGLNLTVTLPKAEETDDGLVATQSQDLGQRNALLMQIIAAVPLPYWQDPPSELLCAASQQDSHLALLTGWRLATQRQHNQEWAKALLTHSLQDASQKSANLEPLFEVLSPAEQETYLSAALARTCKREKWAEWRQIIPRLMTLHPSPSLAFSQVLIQWFRKDCKMDRTRKQKMYPYHLRSLTYDLGYYLHPDSYADASEAVQQLKQLPLDDQRLTLLEEWLEILLFRRSMTQLFTDS